MAKNTKEVNNILERKAIIKMRAELVGLLPDARETLSFVDWMRRRYKWCLTLDEYNDPETDQGRKGDAEISYEKYKCEVKAFNDILEDLYVTLS